jgi:predicted amidohydrolase
MESSMVRAAAVQISPVLFSCAGTTEKVLTAIAQAAVQGVQLIVFPETFIPYYPYFSFIQPPVVMGKEHMRLYEEAVTVPSDVTNAVGQAAKMHHMVVVLGVNLRCRRYAGTKATKDYTHLSRAHGVGTRGWSRAKGNGYGSGKNWGTCLLGAL